LSAVAVVFGGRQLTFSSLTEVAMSAPRRLSSSIETIESTSVVVAVVIVSMGKLPLSAILQIMLVESSTRRINEK
jgi:hypothetical protein